MKVGTKAETKLLRTVSKFVSSAKTVRGLDLYYFYRLFEMDFYQYTLSN